MSEINFEEIYNQYINAIYRFVFVRVNSKEVAQDLSSEAFTRAFEYFRKNPERDIENMQAFLFRTASNLIIDYYRQKSRQNVSIDAAKNNYGVVHTIAARDEHAEVSLERSEQAQKIMSALQGMDSEYADVVMWHFIDDLSVREIAEITGRPEGTIRVMMHRGLKELRARLL